jgi:hypothetical protein
MRISPGEEDRLSSIDPHQQSINKFSSLAQVLHETQQYPVLLLPRIPLSSV